MTAMQQVVLLMLCAGTQALQIKTKKWETKALNKEDQSLEAVVDRPEITGNPYPGKEPNLADFMSVCNYTSEGRMEIRHWMGRFGNNLQQLMSSIIMAEKAGMQKLVVAPYKSGVKEMFDMPYEFTINTIHDKPRGGECVFHSDNNGYDCKTNFYNRCQSTFAERLRVFQEYITPHLRASITDACKGTDEDTVVVHVRDGDTAERMTGRKAQPPCKYYEDIIDKGYDNGAFPKVKLVHGGGNPENPCVAYLQKKYKDKLIQEDESSMAKDMCEVLKAHNLGASMSSFATTLKMMNKNLNRYFYPAFISALHSRQKDRYMVNYDLDIEDVCKVFPKAVRYQLPEAEKKGDDAETYFLSYPQELIRETCQ